MTRNLVVNCRVIFCMKKRIAIIGLGYVGHAHEIFFKDKFDIVVYDPPLGFSDKELVNKADLAIISVPTPMAKDGSADVSIVEETLRWLRVPLIVIKSTVPPGTTQRLIKKYKLKRCLVFSPEFIGEGGYPVPHWEGMPHPTDMKLHRAFIFGGEQNTMKKILPFFTAVRGPFAEYRMTDSTTAELAKYMENSWIATKVIFCNEFFDIAKVFGVSYDELRELWLSDARVGRSHTLVYSNKRGFDGKCIPKDINGIYHASRKRGYSAPFLGAIIETNKRYRVKKK